MQNKIRIPWQGLIVSILFTASIVVFIVKTIQFWTGYILAFYLSQNMSGSIELVKNLPFMFGTAFVVVIILTIIAIGLFYGKKISLLLLTLMLTLSSLNNIIAIFKFLVHKEIKVAFLQLIGLIFIFIIFWLIGQCFKHPYYGGNGKLKWSDLKFWEKKKSFRGDNLTTF